MADGGTAPMSADWRDGWRACLARAVRLCRDAAADERHHTWEVGKACAQEAGRLADALAALDPLAAAEELDPNAPWLTVAHMLCTDHGIPAGPVDVRLLALRDKLTGTLPVGPTVGGNLMALVEPLVSWRPGDPTILLDGAFTAAQLRGMAHHMAKEGRL